MISDPTMAGRGRRALAVAVAFVLACFMVTMMSHGQRDAAIVVTYLVSGEQMGEAKDRAEVDKRDVESGEYEDTETNDGNDEDVWTPEEPTEMDSGSSSGPSSSSSPDAYAVGSSGSLRSKAADGAAPTAQTSVLDTASLAATIKTNKIHQHDPLKKNAGKFGLGDLGRFFDEESIQRNWVRAKADTKALAVEDAEFDLFKSTGPRNLAFIKLHKTGSTSVAASLLRVSREYNKKVLMGRNCNAGESYEMFFLHAPRSKWMEKCLPDTMFVSVLREPAGRFVSLHTWMTNRNYFINLPDRQCDYSGPNPDPKPIKKGPYKCRDDAARHEYVRDKFVAYLESMSPSARPCEPCTWLNPPEEVPRPASPAAIVKRAEERFSLLGVTKHMDAFLLLLALRFDWSVEAILYEKCKQQHKAGIRASDFDNDPVIKDKLEAVTSRERQVYDPIEARFEAYLARLGPGFHDLLADFKRGLQKYHTELKSSRGTNQDRWISASSKSMYC
ncbi:Galactose-3-O-sulfotransferase 3 [Hondaea fermentalgiana]|uniref:Galactose-3-O-sulfotransferase 3 n=1 Tax=Hondaea fermentalgiana TaxID=2315210 RepID=A0A2R5GDQ5_9STRA|nr:Galactose-3-O-sulfotransferase 3 [Hondaea fermentalgiana]|eukprot:GBG29060.1 Galactose-3-O-sulfotransferase 3 [Hondaea fermentalgiana]